MPTKTFFNLREEKRQRIEKALINEFSKSSFEQASITNIIKEANIPRGSFYQYFVDKKDAIGKKKLGIAEAREEAIIKALENVVSFSKESQSLTWEEFISLDIIGDKQKRLAIYDLFHLGYGNAKTLFKRLNMASITKQDILNKLKAYNLQ